ncbi:MAG: pyridoxine 5'-phosphate synthase [Victivallales bacterium]|nr:pyridoxine 5'-phosphate synthase [Victivallales bacterium]
MRLGVNVDHVATLREVRRASFPSPVEAGLVCEKAGAWGITAHLREDRRHIQDADMRLLVSKVQHLNMEMAVTEEMLLIASDLRPFSVCLVPEKRRELTTEGGLDVVSDEARIFDAVARLHSGGIVVSIFIDPDIRQLDSARATGAEYVELHTGALANSRGDGVAVELERLIEASEHAHAIGLNVNAGHGIDYVNIKNILKIPHLKELNIGHSIVSRAVFCGMERAVREMLELMKGYK